MVEHIKQSALYVAEHDWLTSRFLFSFSEYFDVKNMEWGKVRVFNDDTIAPHSGFPLHSHKDAEIVTILHKGKLTHEDSMGNKRILAAPCVQRMSAGSGVVHSEMNQHDEEVELYQLWFYPSKPSLMPSYEERALPIDDNEETILISSEDYDDAIGISTNAKMLKLKLRSGANYSYEFAKETYALLYIRSGVLTSGDMVLEKRDQLRVHGEEMLFMHALVDTEAYLVVTW